MSLIHRGNASPDSSKKPEKTIKLSLKPSPLLKYAKCEEGRPHPIHEEYTNKKIEEMLNKYGPEGLHELAEKLQNIANDDMYGAM